MENAPKNEQKWKVGDNRTVGRALDSAVLTVYHLLAKTLTGHIFSVTQNQKFLLVNTLYLLFNKSVCSANSDTKNIFTNFGYQQHECRRVQTIRTTGAVLQPSSVFLRSSKNLEVNTLKQAI